MRILVTGASGFIGSHTCLALSEDHEVHALVRSIPGRPFVKYCFKDVKSLSIGDVTNRRLLDNVMVNKGIDVVLHLAANSIVKTAHLMPHGTFHNNIMGASAVMDAARICDAKVILQSTDKVYGEKIDALESDPLIVTEPYGASKVCADKLAECYANVYDMDIVITRPCNVYGYDWNNRIIPNTIKKCLRGENPIIFKNDDSLRHYIHVDDVTNAYKQLLECDHVGPINIPGCDVLNQKGVVMKILKWFPDLAPEYVQKPGLQEIHHQSLETELDVIDPPTHTFDQSLPDIIKAYKRWG